MQIREEALRRLERSRFRSSFHLTKREKEYVLERGIDTIREHAADFVRDRLAPAQPRNDGRQTPMRGHPVFVAMHATACCCRGCLNKWYSVPIGTPLTQDQQDRIVGLVMSWIEKQLR